MTKSSSEPVTDSLSSNSPHRLDMSRHEVHVEYLPSGQVLWTQVDGNWDVRELVGFASRRGAKRSILLVSKVLGKHLPVSPSRMAATHRALAEQVPRTLPGPVLFVGFGETATGLGWGVYESWKDSCAREDALYVHTTRYVDGAHRRLEFREEHSHAPSQNVCISASDGLSNRLRSAASLVVVDDEISTGRTARALATALEQAGVPLRLRLALGLVGAYGTSDTGPGGALHGWDVRVLGRISLDFTGHAGDSPTVSVGQGTTLLSADRGAVGWGRFGAERPPTLPTPYVEALVSALGDAADVVLVGAGECMHPAFVLGRALEQRGLRVALQSTTRSPVMIGGAIQRTIECRDPLGSPAQFYLHNPPSHGPRVVVLHEAGGASEAQELALQLGGTALEIWDA